MGLHTGELQLTGEGYAGRELHRAARIAACGHGGQVVVSAATRALVDGDLPELGEHRLKDFDEPVSLFQLGRNRFPPLKTISNTNLPRPASSFVGRERERDELVAMLSDGTRVLTLSGPGGSGKTRLAVEVASELVRGFKAGVFWVGLASLRDPALVTEAIAQTLGAKDGLAEHIGERELLLLLDNFEQVIGAAPELSEVLEACPNLRVLVTSRELLRIRGEVEYPVPPLAQPEAVELFCARSRLEPDQTIAELCRRLDDLPLALELAAARTGVLAPAQILDRLGQRLDLFKAGRDADPRQQTLRATIEWSFDLLTATEKRLFADLAVFAGGSTLDAAEDVCDAALDTLQSLVDKSLVRHSGDRFWMLETIRKFAAEQLQSRPDAGQTLERHARWYMQLAKTARGALHAAETGEWAGRVEAELENVRSALVWARHNDRLLEVELVEATWYSFAQRGLLREALSDLEDALDTAETAPGVDQTEILLGANYVAIRTGDYVAGETWGERALELGRARGDDSVVARALVGLAMVVAQSGDYERARTLYLAAADVAPDSGEQWIVSVVAYNLGEMALVQGDLETARTQFQETLGMTREQGDDGGEAFALVGLSFVALAEADPDEAAVLLSASLRLASRIGAKELTYAGLLGSAEVAVQRTDMARAACLLAATEALREEMGYKLAPSEREQRARIETALGDAALVAAQSGGPAMALGDAVAFALEQQRT